MDWVGGDGEGEYGGVGMIADKWVLLLDDGLLWIANAVHRKVLKVGYSAID